jgi:hypothetical protein
MGREANGNQETKRLSLIIQNHPFGYANRRNFFFSHSQNGTSSLFADFHSFLSFSLYSMYISLYMTGRRQDQPHESLAH